MPTLRAPAMLRLALGIVAALAAACTSGTFAGRTYRDAHVVYEVGPLGSAWRQREVNAGHVTFVNPSGGTILAHATCPDARDLSLDVLTNQLLFGVEHPQTTSRESLTLDGRAALRSRLTGTLDGVPVGLELVVLKKDGCTYDFALVAAPDLLPAREADFSAFVAGFRQIERS